MSRAGRHFTVIDGGTGTKSQRAYIDTGVVNEHGNPFLRIPPGDAAGDGGGVEMKLTLPDLRWNVALLNGLAALFFAGMVGMWLWMVDRIDDKFEIADDRNREIAKDVGEIKAEQAGQSEGIKEILRRLDTVDSQAGGGKK